MCQADPGSLFMYSNLVMLIPECGIGKAISQAPSAGVLHECSDLGFEGSWMGRKVGWEASSGMVLWLTPDGLGQQLQGRLSSYTGDCGLGSQKLPIESASSNLPSCNNTLSASTTPGHGGCHCSQGTLPSP